MCLAFEMDALWSAEMEELARAPTRRSAGVSPALSEDSRVHFDERAPSRGRSSPSARLRGEVKTPAVPASPFVCEETCSQ